MSKTLTIAKADDWVALYVDGKLVTEAHSFNEFDVAEFVVENDISVVDGNWVNHDWLDDISGNFPDSVDDVVWEGDVYTTSK